MVNLFDNETSTGRPAIDIVRVLVLQARANVFEALETYSKDRIRNVRPDQSVLKSRLLSWFMEHQAYLKRVKAKDYDDLLKKLFDFKYDLTEKEIKDLICSLNEALDNLQITKLDTKINYDRKNCEEDNKINGL